MEVIAVVATIVQAAIFVLVLSDGTRVVTICVRIMKLVQAARASLTIMKENQILKILTCHNFPSNPTLCFIND